MDETGQPQRIDSRRWTGRGLGPTRAERRAAWQAFRDAAGPAAAAPRRAAAITCAAGAIPAAIAILAGPAGSGGRLRPLQDALARQVDEPLLRWLADFIGPALALALAGTIAGTLSAWRHRRALARGFAAAPAHLEQGGADSVTALAAIGYLLFAQRAPSAPSVLLTWAMAYLLARGMTLLAERLCAAPRPSARPLAGFALTAAVIVALLAASGFA